MGVQHSWNTSFMFTNAVSFRCAHARVLAGCMAARPRSCVACSHERQPEQAGHFGALRRPRLCRARPRRLQRHADHHLHGTKPYHLLIDYPEAPQLPCSYPAAMMLALVPPLYMRVMDPRCDEFEAQWAQRTAHPQPAAA